VSTPGVQSACLDGTVLPLAEARIPVTDAGLLRGDGVFEVMRLYDGRPFAREPHLARMARSAENLRLELDIGGITRDIDTLLASSEPEDALLRVLATRGGHRIVLIEELPELPEALALGYVTYAPVLLLDGVKSLSYAANMLATRLAHERGFDEALLLSPQQTVLELPTASFFWVSGGELRTPPLSEHLLDSITRRLVIELAGAREAPTTPADLETAEEAFVASSVREVMAVRRIEGRELPGARPVTEATARELRAHIEAQLASG
jgi:branched-chain amino acid aminotransferase